MGLAWPAIPLENRSRAPAVPNQSSAGLRILIPGYPQWSWRQRERAIALFGSFAAALVVGAFAWGTPTGVAILFFAFGAHVLSVVDVVRQSAFPGFGRWMPLASASGGLALAVYAPALAFASLVAWPVPGQGVTANGYLVNRVAYRGAEPRRGDCVWLRADHRGDPRVGLVVATSGEEVQWNGKQLRIDGKTVPLEAVFPASLAPDELAFTIPEGHMLVSSDLSLVSGFSSDSLTMVARDHVKGRAWAQFYPLWNRRLLR